MKTICFIADRNIYLKRICNYLAQEGYKVQLICRSDKGLNIEEFDSRIQIYHLQSKRLIGKILEISRFIKINRPDYLHFQYLVKDVISAIFIPKRVKVIITPWGSDLNIFSKSILNRIVVNIGLLTTDRIQFISEGLRSKLLKKFWFISKKKCVDLTWGIDYEHFHSYPFEDISYWNNKLSITPESIVLLSYRNHAPIYNHHTLIKSLPMVIEKYPNVKCIFTRGSYDKAYLEQSKELVKKLQLQNHVIFIEEWIRDELMPSLINMANIVFSIPFYDGLPATLLEIMSTRAIPVISKVEGFGSFFENGTNGFVLNEHTDFDELSEITLDIIANYYSVIEKISKINNKYIAQNQNWAIQSIKLKDLYK